VTEGLGFNERKPTPFAFLEFDLCRRRDAQREWLP
jgi:hypothetical protein